MPLLEILIILVIWFVVSIAKDLGVGSHRSTLDRPGNLERCGREMVGKSQKECRQILKKYMD